MSPSDSDAELKSAYLDGMLEPERARAFEEDLAADPSAKQEVDDLQRLLALVGDLPPVEAPSDFLDKLTKKTRRLPRGQEGWLSSYLTLPFQVLSVVVILVIAVTYLMLELQRQDARIEAAEPASDGLHETSESHSP